VMTTYTLTWCTPEGPHSHHVSATHVHSHAREAARRHRSVAVLRSYGANDWRQVALYTDRGER
jgi:hypothetical protein